jgi:hypothetical protein
VNNNVETTIIILHRERTILPVSTNAFTISQSSSKELNEAYIGATVIWKNGKQAMIERIVTEGLYGESFLSKVHSALFGVKSINIQFSEESNVDLEGFKEAVIELIKLDSERGDPNFLLESPVDVICSEIRDAKEVQNIFKAINVPDPQECLDVL